MPAKRLGGDGRNRLDAGGKPRQLTCDGVEVRHALAGRALHLRLRRAQCIGRGGLVAGGDRHLDLLHEGPHARLARGVPLSAGRGLTNALPR